MKEKFEDRRLTGTLNVACKYDDGTVRYWEDKKEAVVAHIVSIVNEYRRQGYILTLRQLHYQLVTRNWIINHDTAYKKLGTILDDCRYAGVIDWEMIEDRGRIPDLPYCCDDPAGAIDDTVEQYRVDRQRNQDIAVELWTEKDALSGILKRSTHEYHVNLVVNKGYTSSSAMYRAYNRIADRYNDDSKRTIILYFGDHDPSGLDMIRDIDDRLKFMLEKGTNEFDEASDVFELKQIGLNTQQIKKYKLPPNPTKLTDTRAAGYIAKYGKTCWEVDALSPDVLTGIVQANIESVIDMDLFQEMLDVEQEDIKILKGLIR